MERARQLVHPVEQLYGAGDWGGLGWGWGQGWDAHLYRSATSVHGRRVRDVHDALEALEGEDGIGWARMQGGQN